MRALIADDDRTTTLMLSRMLTQWGIAVTTAHDGQGAWEVMIGAQRPSVAILDWMMPDVDGLELCRRIREDESLRHLYVILLTSRDSRADLIQGLNAGADDYLVKPFDPDELRARLHVGLRVVGLQERLAQRVDELQKALSQVKQLHGLLPICSYCKRIRSDTNYWQAVETYIADHSDAQSSHGICPACFDTVMAELGPGKE
jgi:sigma-B regulation protein RsbU (phosphoserine phosphatase)